MTVNIGWLQIKKQNLITKVKFSMASLFATTCVRRKSNRVTNRSTIQSYRIFARFWYLLTGFLCSYKLVRFYIMICHFIDDAVTVRSYRMSQWTRCRVLILIHRVVLYLSMNSLYTKSQVCGSWFILTIITFYYWVHFTVIFVPFLYEALRPI